MGVYQFFRDFAGPLATALASVVAVIVTWRVTWRIGNDQVLIARQQADLAGQQAELATVRLKHDLFDRRFEIYETVLAFLIEIFQHGNISDDGISKFVRGTQKAVFVFDQSVVEYFEQLRIQALTLQEQAIFVGDQRNPVGPERTEAAHRKAELFRWFNDQFPVLIQRLKPFMALDENTASRPYPPITGSREPLPTLENAQGVQDC
jgi:hypothetical protein